MSALRKIKPVLWVLMAVAGLAQASPLARSVLEASPVDEIVAQYPAMMSEGVRQGLSQSGQVDPMVVATVTAVVRNAFRAADMEAELVSDLDSAMSDGQLQAVGNWYQTAVAEKVSRAEIAASHPDAWPQVQQGAAERQARFKGTERAEMFTRYDRAARATETAVDTTLAVQLGMASALSAFQGSAGPGFDQLRQMIESRREQTRAVVAQQVYDMYLYTYSEVSVDELKEYIGFLESDAGARFTGVVTNSLQQSITRPVETVGRQLARFFGPS